MLRDAAIRWVRTNCSNQRLQANFVRNLDEAIAAGVNCAFVIGKRLTRASEPYLIHWFAGEMFVFQLTSRQATRLGVGPEAMRFTADDASVPDGPAAMPCFALEGLELEQPVLSDLSRPIMARCRYRVTGSVPPSLAFRMDFSQGANDGERTFCTFAYPMVVPSPGGTVHLEFEAGDLMPGTILNPVMAVFVRCFAVNQQPAIHWPPISNPVAATLELAEGFRQ